jgi:septal ring factor EnvC (AmiA/AmiB activator)
MSDKELNRRFDFIAEQLAQTVVGLQIMKEVHEADYVKLDKRMSRLEGAFVGTYNTVTKQSEQIEDLRKSVEGLRDESKEQRELMMETRERLDIFIVMLERYISRSENGSSGSSDKK